MLDKKINQEGTSPKVEQSQQEEQSQNTNKEVGPKIKTASGNTVVLTKNNIKDYYGIKVNDYTAGGATYRLFYVDFDGKFGEKDTIYLKADYDSSREENTGSANFNLAKVSDIFWKMNPELEETESRENYDVESESAYLCDKDLWTKYCDSTKADFAIGTPSIEMYAASYNQVPHTNGKDKIDVVYTWQSGDMQDIHGYAYPYGRIDNVGYNKMYTGRFWLASPSIMAGICFVADYRLANLPMHRTEIAICPIVSLKTNFTPTLDI